MKKYLNQTQNEELPLHDNLWSDLNEFHRCKAQNKMNKKNQMTMM